MATEKKSTDVAVQEERPLVPVTLLQKLEVLKESLAPGERLDASVLERVKNPTGGGKNWELSSGEAAQTIEGVIVTRQPVRAFWKDSFAETGGGVPPDCVSFDLIDGRGDNGTGTAETGQTPHSCEGCPQAQFGSAINDKGEPVAGQACRQITRLFVLREGEALPVMMALAPTSYVAGRRYTTSLASRGIPFHSVVTSVGLDQKASQGGIEYSFATFATIRELEPEELVEIEQYRAEMMPWLLETAIQESE